MNRRMRRELLAGFVQWELGRVLFNLVLLAQAMFWLRLILLRSEEMHHASCVALRRDELYANMLAFGILGNVFYTLGPFSEVFSVACQVTFPWWLRLVVVGVILGLGCMWLQGLGWKGWNHMQEYANYP